MAKDRWAAVQLILDSRCDVDRGDGYLNGRGISYSSVSDFLVFQGFWPWTQADYFDLIHFDTEGMVSHIDPCPHALAAKELDQLRALGQHALIAATTEGEKRMLTRIVDRLAATDGKSLASGQGGCTDLPPEWYNKVRPREDPWTDR